MADEKIAALEAAGVDVKEGLQYCRNNEKIFLKIIQKYAAEAETKITELRGYYENKDYQNYEIQVHGLKSSSKTMGVMEVSELAKEQEFAAKEGNYAKIDEDHETLFSLYDEMSKKILAALSGEAPSGGTGASVDKAALVGKLTQLVEYLEMFEAMKAEEIVDELLGCTLPDESSKEQLKTMKSQISDFDMRGASKIAGEMLAALS